LHLTGESIVSVAQLLGQVSSTTSGNYSHALRNGSCRLILCFITKALIHKGFRIVLPRWFLCCAKELGIGIEIAEYLYILEEIEYVAYRKKELQDEA